MAATKVEGRETAPSDLGALLDAGEGAVVTVTTGQTRLAAHRAVLAAGSPVFAAMFGHEMLEGSTGEVTIPDVEGPVLRQLVAFLYTGRAPQLPATAPQLLAAADKYGVTALKDSCERLLAEQLSVDNVVAAAVLAIKHSCHSLQEATADLMRANTHRVMETQGWAEAEHSDPDAVVEFTRLLAKPSGATGAPAATGSEATPTTRPRGRAPAPAASAPPAARRHSPPPDAAAVSRFRSLSGEERGRRLREAAGQGAVEEVRALLAAGVEVGARDEWRQTALHWGAVNGHVEEARLLLRGGGGAQGQRAAGDASTRGCRGWPHGGGAAAVGVGGRPQRQG